MSTSSDDEVLEYAAQHNRIVVSHDVNTMSAAAYGRVADGELMRDLVRILQDKPIGPVVDDLVLIWTASDAADWIGIVQFLPFAPHAAG